MIKVGDMAYSTKLNAKVTISTVSSHWIWAYEKNKLCAVIHTPDQILEL